MKPIKTTRLGAALALALAIAAPIAAAVPADAATFRAKTIEVVHAPREMTPVHYDHRGELSYRDMNWRVLRLHRDHRFEHRTVIIRDGR